jgi:sulfur-oxidizing protein SoxX
MALAPQSGARRVIAAAFVCAAAIAVGPVRAQVASYEIVGDAVPEALDGKTGDVARGRQVVLDRNNGNCLICHAVPEPQERFMGELGPDLTGVGARLSAGQIRLRLIDQSVLNPATVMPPYHRVKDLVRVATRYRDTPVLTAQDIEDAVAYLAALTTSK